LKHTDTNRFMQISMCAVRTFADVSLTLSNLIHFKARNGSRIVACN